MRKGIIKITDKVYKTQWADIYIFFMYFRPTHIEFRHWENDVWVLYGESEFFDEINEGEAIPVYDVVFTRLFNGKLGFKFERR